MKVQEAEWSTAFVNDLPDASFALILPGGEQDADGKTTPRSLRKLPYKDADGAVDVPHLRNALARISQVDGASAAQIASAQAKLDAAAKEYLGDEEEPEAEEESAAEETTAPEPEAAPEPAEEAEEMDPTAAAQGADAAVAGAIEHLQAALEVLGGLMQAEEPEPEDDMEAEAVAELAETAALQLAEAEAPANRRAPLHLDVGIIKVGPGNQRDNHYYSAEMLEACGDVFQGAKMYTTDHREDERSVRTEVSLLESIQGVQEFDDGNKYLVGRAIVFNPDFAEDVRNRADAGVLGSLHCSILASGEAQPGKIGEEEFNIVQRITEARSVDWVTQAGAGGHALQLSEAEAEAEEEAAVEPEPAAEPLDESAVQQVTISENENEGEEAIQPLALAEVVAELGKTNLPASSVATLTEQQYSDTTAVQEAVAAEVARLKAAGSGQPLGVASAPAPAAPSLQEIEAAQQAVNRKYLGR